MVKARFLPFGRGRKYAVPHVEIYFWLCMVDMSTRVFLWMNCQCCGAFQSEVR